MLTIAVPELEFTEVPLERETRVVRSRSASAEALSAPLTIALGIPQAQSLTTEIVKDDVELRAFIEQHSDSRFSLVHMACSFQPDEHQPFSKAWLHARLSLTNRPKTDPPPIAWSLDPLRVADAVTIERTRKLGTSLKFHEFGGELGSEVKEGTTRSIPFLEAVGELRSDPYWVFTKTEQTPIRGPFRFSMVVKAPAKFTAQVHLSVSAEVETRKWGFLTYRTPSAETAQHSTRL